MAPYGCHFHEDPREIAAEYRRALAGADPKSMLKLAASSELRLNSMSSEDFSRFVREWVLPKIHGRAWIPVTIGKTDEGMKVVQPVSSLVLAFAALRKNGSPPKTALEKLHDYTVNIPAFEGELALYHVRFICPNPNSDPMTVEQFAKFCSKRYRDLTTKADNVSRASRAH
jgi:hypothetical protein